MASGGWRPAEQLFGLWVDCGHYSTSRGRWLRPPYARYCCPRGCLFEARGHDQVAAFTKALNAHHARHCPGAPTTS